MKKQPKPAARANKNKASANANSPKNPTTQGLRLLFIHQNFPSPFLNLARHYTSNPNNVVAVVGQTENLQRSQSVPGALLFGYSADQVLQLDELAQLGELDQINSSENSPAAASLLSRDFELCVRRGLAAKSVFTQLAEANFTPDCIIGDPAWGEMLFVRQIFPHTPILARAECYFDLAHPLWDFDPEVTYDDDARNALCTGQMASLRAWAEANMRYSATHAQQASFPPLLRAGIDVLHEGVRTDVYKPGPARPLHLPPSHKMVTADNAPLPAYVPQREKTLTLEANLELVVYFSRVLEPHRGYHTFMRALPTILKRHPKAHCVIVGRTHGGYGPPPLAFGQQQPAAMHNKKTAKQAKKGADLGANSSPHNPNLNWRDIFLNEVKDQLDFNRVHFTGNVSDETALLIMQRARAFVAPSCLPWAAWSPLEAMACGAPLITTDNVALRELTNNGKAALLVPFFDAQALADAVSQSLENTALRLRLAGLGRAFMLQEYDFNNVCLPRWQAAVQSLTALNAI